MLIVANEGLHTADSHCQLLAFAATASLLADPARMSAGEPVPGGVLLNIATG